MFEKLLPSKNSVPLIIKAVIFGLLLLYAQLQDFSLLPVLVFLIFGAYMYLSPIFKTSSLIVSLAVLLTLSLLVTSQFALSLRAVGLETGLPIGAVLFSLAFAALFYLLLGIKNSLFVRRRVWYYVLYLCFMYLAFGLFFNSLSTAPFLLKIILLFVFLILIIREFFKFNEYPKDRLSNISAATLAFILAELAWALSLLPIGFSALSSVLVVSSYILIEFTHRYLKGELAARFIRRSSVLFLALIVIIFFSSRWTL